MADLDYEGEVTVVTFTDDEGHETHYEEDMVINYDGKRFAVLVSLPPEDCEPGCKCQRRTGSYHSRIE